MHKGKQGTKQVTFEISPELRAEVMRTTGAKLLTEAVHEALADVVLRHYEEGALHQKREHERQWVKDNRLGEPFRQGKA
jgi:Arc/MetJ family transcription regulator